MRSRKESGEENLAEEAFDSIYTVCGGVLWWWWCVVVVVEGGVVAVEGGVVM